MARMGMDVDAVEAAGNNLRNKAHQIETLTADIDRIVQGLTNIWDGQDARQFVQEWWPGHKKNLRAIQEAINGLGQSALNNATDQRAVSRH